MTKEQILETNFPMYKSKLRTYDRDKVFSSIQQFADQQTIAGIEATKQACVKILAEHAGITGKLRELVSAIPAASILSELKNDIKEG